MIRVGAKLCRKVDLEPDLSITGLEDRKYEGQWKMSDKRVCVCMFTAKAGLV